MAYCEDAPCCGCCDPRELSAPMDPLDEDTLDCGADDEPDDDMDGGDMDGDHASALASCGWGTDEDYGDWGASSMFED